MNNNREPLHFSPFPLMGFSPYAVGSRSLFENRADRQTLFNRSMSELNKRINFNALEVPILEGLSALFFSLTTRPSGGGGELTQWYIPASALGPLTRLCRGDVPDNS